MRQPFAVPAGDLELVELADPALLVAGLRERLGLAAAALLDPAPAGADPLALLPAELGPAEPGLPNLASGALP